VIPLRDGLPDLLGDILQLFTRRQDTRVDQLELWSESFCSGGEEKKKKGEKDQ
jgi:hypothetical protein